MATTNKTGIVNRALGKIGGERITDISDVNDPLAIKYNDIFDDIFEEVLDAHTWNFAIFRKTLVRSPDAPNSNEWEFQYFLPTDPLIVKPMSVNTEYASDFYRIEGNRLLTNAEEAILQYVGLVNISACSKLFLNAVATRLAAELAYDITSSRTMQAEMYNLYELDLQKAVSADNFSDGDDIYQDPEYLQVRLGQNAYDPNRGF